MARRRMIWDNFLIDRDINSVSVPAQLLFVRMIVKTDDYGIIPADVYTMEKSLNLPRTIMRKLDEHIRELTDQQLITGFVYDGKPYFSLKRDRFDEYQAYLINKRTRSECLRLPSEVMESEAWLKIISNKMDSEGLPRSPVKPLKEHFDANTLQIPQSLASRPDFMRLWRDWLAERAGRRLKNTERALTEQLAFLSKQPDPAECLRRAIAGEWQGLHELTTSRSVARVSTVKPPVVGPSMVSAGIHRSAFEAFLIGRGKRGGSDWTIKDGVFHGTGIRKLYDDFTSSTAQLSGAK
jgi:hypothetical protein